MNTVHCTIGKLAKKKVHFFLLFTTKLWFSVARKEIPLKKVEEKNLSEGKLFFRMEKECSLQVH